jgi:spermidine synthase
MSADPHRRHVASGLAASSTCKYVQCMLRPDRNPPRIVERVAGRQGELVLRAAGNDYEIITNGVFLMDTRNGESERLLARVALRHRRELSRLLIGGLGVGFSLVEALRSDLLERVTVVEIEPAVIEWNRTYLASHSRNALADPRVEVVCEELVAWRGRAGESFDGICLDVDNGPAWTVTDANAALYSNDGLELLRNRLEPGGALTVWSAAEDHGFTERLRRALGRLEIFTVPMPPGEPDVIYTAWRS